MMRADFGAEGFQRCQFRVAFALTRAGQPLRTVSTVPGTATRISEENILLYRLASRLESRGASLHTLEILRAILLIQIQIRLNR